MIGNVFEYSQKKTIQTHFTKEFSQKTKDIVVIIIFFVYWSLEISYKNASCDCEKFLFVWKVLSLIMAITIRSLFTFDLSGPTCKIIIHYNGLYNIKCSTRERIEHNILAILRNGKKPIFSWFIIIIFVIW